MPENFQIISSRIQNKIYTIRGERVMIDRDLAEIYGVETRALNQAVKRNSERFPSDFMFQLTDIEFQNWKSQIVMSNTINDMNEDTRMQIELINQSLAELHIDKKQNTKPRNKIGFITE